MTDVVQHRSSGSPKAQRKPSSPKAKGAVRAKSGCYTCRIRRKKCDERPDADGNCQTCVRLRLQCLGFGAKRPDWMRENNSVSELREKIKGFLAAQGMIKGHSGSGPRCAEQDPSVLVLSGDTGSSTPSPQTRTLSTSSGDSPRPSGPVTSYVRDGPMPYSSSGSDGSSYNLPSIYPPHSQQSSHIQHHQQLSPDSPMPRGTVHPDIMLPSFHHLPSHSHSHSQMLNSSLVTVNSPTTWNIPPPIKSSFGPLYQHNIIYDDEDMSALHLPTLTEYSIPAGAAPPSMTRFGSDALVEHYLRNVLKIQYILADPSIRNFIMPLADHEPTYHAICFLSSVHRHRMGGALRIMADDEEAVHRDNTKRALEVALNKSGGFSEGDAMAGLHCVSSYLFSGGRGPWEYFLNVARRWVSDILRNPNHNQSLQGVLLNSGESTRFIIRTTMWFDVIASVSLCQTPHFLVEYRELFGGQHAFISGEGYGSPSFSMMSVMGCDNRTFLSLAEISALAEWKERQIRTGRLSAPELVKRGQEIEKELLNTFDTDSECTQTFTNSEEADLDARRRLTAEVFRASARVYLHSVLSGDYPACPEIAEGVRDTIAALKRVPADQPLSSRSVVRSVVFPICIAGCLTDDKSQRQFLMAKLQEQEAESVGNCSEVQNVIKSVWRERDRKRIAVSWRDVMKANGPILLV